MRMLYQLEYLLFIVCISLPVCVTSQVVKTYSKVEYIVCPDSLTELYKINLCNKEKKQVYLTWYDNSPKYYDYISQIDKVILRHLNQKRGDFSIRDFMFDEFYPPVNLQESFYVAGFTKQLSSTEMFTYYVFCNPNKIVDVLNRIVVVKQEDVRKILGADIWPTLLYGKSECILLPNML